MPICLLLLFAVPPARAAVFNLRADATTITLPGGIKIPMWGFALDSRFGAGDGAVSVPGPQLTLDPGDTTLTINLKNNLTQARTGLAGGVAVSLIVPALPAALAPVAWPTGPYAGRVRSLNAEAPPGNSAPVAYTWTNVKPGTFLYHSATQMQVQVQMGLYGALIKNSGPREAYPGAGYGQDLVLLYSEIDPALHRAVAGGAYGPGKAVTSTIDYHPRWFLVNGAPYTPGLAPCAVTRGQRVLVRMLNAGLESHVPTLLGGTWSLLAEDGNPYPHPREQYTAPLAAGKTLDALLVAGANGRYPIFDHMLDLMNDASAPGGMVRQLNAVDPVGGAPTARPDAFTASQDAPLRVAAPGVLANDAAPPGGPALTARLVNPPTSGTLALASDGSFSYTPRRGFVGADSFTYLANNTQWDSAPASVALQVQVVYQPPLTAMKHYTIKSGATLSVAAPGVLVGDRDPQGWPLAALLSEAPSTGTLSLAASGAFTFTPPAGFSGNVYFRYRASDGKVQSPGTRVAVAVTARNGAPAALGDEYGVRKGATLTVAGPGVLGNDRDPDGDTLMASLATAPAHGTAVLNADGSFSYTPGAGFSGRDTFDYAATDSVLATRATVVVNVVP